MGREGARWGSGRKLALQIALLPVAVLAVELALRVWLLASGQAFDADAAKAEILRAGTWMEQGFTGEDGPAEERSVFLHPYVGFGNRETREDILATQRYFAEHAAGTLDVMLFGGSVAVGLANAASGRLKETLAADPRLAHRPIKIHTFARAGYKQPQQLLYLSYLLCLGIEPDVVVNLDGFNEVAIGFSNGSDGAHPLYPSWGLWARVLSSNDTDPAGLDRLLRLWSEVRRTRDTAEGAVDRGFYQSAVLTRLTLWRLSRLREQGSLHYEEFTAQTAGAERPTRQLGPMFRRGRQNVLEQVVAGWVEASVSMRALCAERSIVYVHVLQPTLHDEGSKPLSEEEVRNAGVRSEWIEGAREGYPLLRAAGAELLRRDVHFVDASSVFADRTETTYVDFCHLDQPGSWILAEAIGRGVLAALE